MTTRALERLGYNYDTQNIQKRGLYNLDYFLCLVYLSVSLLNTAIGINNLHFTVGADKSEYINTIVTTLLIIINAVELLRLNIKLYLQSFSMEKQILDGISEEQKNLIEAVRIRPLDKRLSWIKGCYIIDAVIFVLNLVYIKHGIGTSLCVMIFMPIIVVFCNNVIDISKEKYQATEQITYEVTQIRKE